MRAYSLRHLSDTALLRDLLTFVARDRATTAIVLAHLAEVDFRKLYLPAGYPSMFAYCMGELHLSEDAAYKRIQAARAARDCPALFEAVADGRLHLAALCLLAPHLTPENAEELIAAATHHSKFEIDQMLTRRCATRETSPARASVRVVKPWITRSTVEESPSDLLLAPGQVEGAGSRSAGSATTAPAPPVPRYSLHLTIEESTHNKLRRAQDLLGHSLPSGDLSQVIDRALDALIDRLEKQKFASTPKPRTPRRESARDRHAPARDRHIPAHVRRVVSKRDGGRCTFVSQDGRRCPARKLLEFDHVQPVARGGKATIDGIRLRCRGHNQYEAERAFGRDFMRRKRDEAARKNLRAPETNGEAATLHELAPGQVEGSAILEES